jgi:hypothetical protein
MSRECPASLLLHWPASLKIIRWDTSDFPRAGREVITKREAILKL